MLTKLSVKNFQAVAHLGTSSLMKSHRKGLTFSNEKPNIVVGPNGAGKTALMTALSMLTLSHYYEESSLDDHYVRGRDSDNYWTKEGSAWSTDETFLQGLISDSDMAPALFYRPGHIPGNDSCVVNAMISGYMDIARDYGNSTDNLSSGQQSLVVLEKIRQVLQGKPPSKAHGFINWSSGEELRDMTNGRRSSCDFRAEFLKQRYLNLGEHVKPMLLMDEPEQSLDAKAEALLWNQIAAADCSQMQIIVATHSLHPLLKPERFNIIEAVPGYAAEVIALM